MSTLEFALGNIGIRPKPAKPTKIKRFDPNSGDRWRQVKARRLAAGNCMQCGERPHVPDRKSCQDCLDSERRRLKAYRKNR